MAQSSIKCKSCFLDHVVHRIFSNFRKRYMSLTVCLPLPCAWSMTMH